MDEDVFVKQYLNNKPIEEDLISRGFDSAAITDILSEYNFKLKNNAKLAGKYLVERLLLKYDLSNFRVGEISFIESTVEDSEYIQFGWFDVFRLVICKSSQQIALLDEYENSICEYCAKNEILFLSAIFKAQVLLNQFLLDGELSSDQEKVCIHAYEIANVAGGKAYLNFFKTLLGCFE